MRLVHDFKTTHTINFGFLVHRVGSPSQRSIVLPVVFEAGFKHLATSATHVPVLPVWNVAADTLCLMWLIQIQLLCSPLLLARKAFAHSDLQKLS